MDTSDPALTEGEGLTVTVTLSVAEQLLTFVTSNVYSSVPAGDASGLCMSVALSPAAGVH